MTPTPGSAPHSPHHRPLRLDGRVRYIMHQFLDAAGRYAARNSGAIRRNSLRPSPTGTGTRHSRRWSELSLPLAEALRPFVNEEDAEAALAGYWPLVEASGSTFRSSGCD